MTLTVGIATTGEALPHLCHRPAVDWMLDGVEALAPAVLMVTGPGADAVRERIALRPELKRCRTDGGAEPDQVTLVLPGSIPLLRPKTLRRVVAALAAEPPVRAALLTPARPVPWWAEYAATDGPVALAVAGPHGLDADELAALGTAAAGGDRAGARRRLEAAGARVRTVRLRGVDALRLTDPADRVKAENALYRRVAAGWQAAGVLVDDPATTRIDADVHIGAGARIRPFTELLGATVIGPGSRIGPSTTVRDSRVGADCEVWYSICQDVEIGDGANIGPFSWLRSGTRLDARCRVGSFVEVADSVVGEGTAIPHLSGILTADVGRDCNVGGMSGFANFDGVRKQRSRVGDNVRIGANTIMVSPISIGDGAATAAGSIITRDVPDGALATSRGPQRTVAGWAARDRTGPAAAAAAS
jgi:bifunctional UDP-N-acetylglucosamine pyrophosphorylase/glucosamine-1-phosphate N-acetyltransferase